MLPNWEAVTDRLYVFTCATIERFVSEHPDEVCSFFAYDVDLPFFLASFDTPANALKVARQAEQEAIERRAKMLTIPDAWRVARSFSMCPPVLDYCYSTGDFAYHIFDETKLDELEDLHFAEDYPEYENADDYAEGNTRIMLWRMIERLIASDNLNCLQLAAPFRIGYQMHDDDLTILRILNWPAIP